MFMFVAFSDRSETLRLYGDLKARGVVTSVINTPREAAVGCGLSVRFSVNDLGRVRSVLASRARKGLIGTFKSVGGVISRLF